MATLLGMVSDGGVVAGGAAESERKEAGVVRGVLNKGPREVLQDPLRGVAVAGDPKLHQLHGLQGTASLRRLRKEALMERMRRAGEAASHWRCSRSW